MSNYKKLGLSLVFFGSLMVFQNCSLVKSDFSVIDLSSQSTSSGNKTNSTDSSNNLTNPVPVIPVYSPESVTVHIVPNNTGANVASFGLPLPVGKVTNVNSMRAYIAGTTTPISGVNAKVILGDYGKTGNLVGVKSVLIQFPMSYLSASGLDVQFVFNGSGTEVFGSQIVAYSTLQKSSSEIARVVDRSLQFQNGQYSIVESNQRNLITFSAWEPPVLVTFPDSYLAKIDVAAKIMSKSDLDSDATLSALKFISSDLDLFMSSATYKDNYNYNPIMITGTGDPNEFVRDPIRNFEGWLYDRCATYMMTALHLQNQKFLKDAMRTCSYYSNHVSATGYFTGKDVEDPKYSHIRGLYTYYALTGDEAALEAAKNIANMWLNDVMFVAPYAEGHTRAIDKLWTERLLGVSVEGLVYGFLITGDSRYFQLATKIISSAYTHITTNDINVLNTIIQSNLNFPPQNCFIHSAAQADEGNYTDPWCSGWMNELLIDPLLRYQALTDDNRVDEIFIRLVRFMRDTAANYFQGDVLVNESFLNPSKCFDPSNTDNPRILIPSYGAGINAAGTTIKSTEYDDYQHCADASGLTAAGLRALVRTQKFNAKGVGPFVTEGESFLALHHEFTFCAQYAFNDSKRPNRNPTLWDASKTSQAINDYKVQNSGFVYSDSGWQQKFFNANLIGFLVNGTSPMRKLSWWFNSMLLQPQLIKESGLSISTLYPGQVQPAGCTYKAPKVIQ